MVNGYLSMNFSWLKSIMDWAGVSIHNMALNLWTTGANCGLHLLIHTFTKFNLAQDINWCQGGEKESPH